MMKAVEIQKTGGPEVLELKDISLSDPSEGEVLIKQVAIGLNYIDTYHRSGLYPVPLPSGIGLEGAGIIEKVGSDTDGFNVGDKVCYAAAPIGSYATHRIYPTKSLVKVPDEIDLEIVAAIMTKGLTTFYLLHKTYEAKSGETVLFHAAAGGVGQIFCQWAKSLGCTVIGTVGSDEKIETAKEYVDSGDYYWNSGMFMFKASRYLEELEKYNPEMLDVCKRAIDTETPDLDFWPL